MRRTRLAWLGGLALLVAACGADDDTGESSDDLLTITSRASFAAAPGASISSYTARTSSRWPGRAVLGRHRNGR